MLKRIDLAIYVLLKFLATHLIKNLTDREVILDIVRVWPKYGEWSCDDCSISKQNFRASENLVQHPLHATGTTGRVSGHGRPIIPGRWGVTSDIRAKLKRMWS